MNPYATYFRAAALDGTDDSGICVDFDHCALGNVDRRTPSADHRWEAELAGHDGRVAEGATLFDD